MSEQFYYMLIGLLIASVTSFVFNILKHLLYKPKKKVVNLNVKVGFENGSSYIELIDKDIHSLDKEDAILIAKIETTLDFVSEADKTKTSENDSSQS